MNRRDFLKSFGGGIIGVSALSSLPTIVPAAALGRDGNTAPSNRITMGMIGYGWMGESNTSSFLALNDVQIVAMCDVYEPHLKKGKDTVDTQYGNKDCAAYGDFRELLERNDIDALMMALPDHWHAVPAIMALRKGLDVYGEKPIARTVKEGRAICDAVSRYKRVWQTGSWQRSRENFHKGAELVRNGRIGKITHVDVGYGGGLMDFEKTRHLDQPTDVPQGLNYDMWLGPAPYAPYCPARVHKNWRNLLDYGGGMLTDWIGHHLDIAHWGLGFDNTGPVEITGNGNFVPGLYDVPENFDVFCTYANGVTVRISNNLKPGCRWYGDNGKWIHVNRGSIEANPASVLNERIGAEEIHLPKSVNHYRNFIDRVKDRGQTLTHAESSHRAATVGSLGLISILEGGRTLRWDPEKEEFPNDAAANRRLTPHMRSPWSLEI